MRSERKSIDNRIAALEKRMAWLEKRVSTSTHDLSYDKQELSALRWAVPLLRGMIQGERDRGSVCPPTVEYI